MAERILRRPEVSSRTGFGRSTLYALVQSGRFPKPIKLGSRASGWLESEVDQWIESQKAARDAKASAE